MLWLVVGIVIGVIGTWLVYEVRDARETQMRRDDG